MAESTPLYMYILVNNDCKMGKGKIAGQVGHAVGLITENILTNYYENPCPKNAEVLQRYDSWKDKGHAKIILKATDAEMLAFVNEKESVAIRDAGRTQIAPNTLTVVGFYPNAKLSNKFKHFKLL